MTEYLKRHLFWAILLGAFLFYHFGALSGAQSQAEKDWRTAAGLAVRAGKPFRATIDSLKRRETTLLTSIRATRSRVDTILATIPRDSIPASVLLVLADQSRALDQCEEVISTCQTRAALAQGRADSLETLLSRGLVVTKCKWWLFPCPSRAVTFIAGAAGGFLLSGAIR